MSEREVIPPTISRALVTRIFRLADPLPIFGSEMKRLGRVAYRWVGDCPFCEVRTPSFEINAERRLYYCHRCGRNGDLISFVSDIYGLDFEEAVKWLAASSGLDYQREAAVYALLAAAERASGKLRAEYDRLNPDAADDECWAEGERLAEAIREFRLSDGDVEVEA